MLEWLIRRRRQILNERFCNIPQIYMGNFISYLIRDSGLIRYCSLERCYILEKRYIVVIKSSWISPFPQSGDILAQILNEVIIQYFVFGFSHAVTTSTAVDSSANSASLYLPLEEGLNPELQVTTGMIGSAISFDGRRDWINAGKSFMVNH